MSKKMRSSNLLLAERFKKTIGEVNMIPEKFLCESELDCDVFNESFLEYYIFLAHSQHII